MKYNMNEKENIECKWLVDKSGDLFLTRRRRSLRRAGGTNKPFYFSHNPNNPQVYKIGSSLESEINLLKQLVKQKYNKEAFFIPEGKYWKLSW